MDPRTIDGRTVRLRCAMPSRSADGLPPAPEPPQSPQRDAFGAAAPRPTPPPRLSTSARPPAAPERTGTAAGAPAAAQRFDGQPTRGPRAAGPVRGELPLQLGRLALPLTCQRAEHPLDRSTACATPRQTAAARPRTAGQVREHRPRRRWPVPACSRPQPAARAKVGAREHPDAHLTRHLTGRGRSPRCGPHQPITSRALTGTAGPAAATAAPACPAGSGSPPGTRCAPARRRRTCCRRRTATAGSSCRSGRSCARRCR